MSNPGEQNNLPTGDVDSQGGRGFQGDGVTLSREEYANIVAANSSLRAQLDMVVQSLQEQMDQAPQGRQQTTQTDNIPTNDVDSMSNTQLLGYIQQQMAAPILQSVMNLAIKEEIRECEKEFEDFPQFKDSVYKIASANTTISLRDAYLQAKAGKTFVGNKQKVNELPPADKAPNNPPPTAPQGQRPNQTTPGSALLASSALSIKDAAMKALKESQYTE